MGRITAIARLPTPVTHLTAPTAAATLHLTATATPDLTAPTAAATLHLTATATPHRTVITDHPATTGGLLGFSTEGRRVGLGHLRLPTNSARRLHDGGSGRFAIRALPEEKAPSSKKTGPELD